MPVDMPATSRRIAWPIVATPSLALSSGSVRRWAMPAIAADDARSSSERFASVATIMKSRIGPTVAPISANAPGEVTKSRAPSEATSPSAMKSPNPPHRADARTASVTAVPPRWRPSRSAASKRSRSSFAAAF